MVPHTHAQTNAAAHKVCGDIEDVEVPAVRDPALNDLRGDTETQDANCKRQIKGPPTCCVDSEVEEGCEKEKRDEVEKFVGDGKRGKGEGG